MKVTVNVNIGGVPFVVDDDAYELLKNYLCRISSSITAKEDKKEILSDIERRISELLLEEGVTYSRVVTISYVKKVLSVIGDADIFGENSDYNTNHYSIKPSKRLMRDSENITIGGVCSGVAAFIGVDPTVIKIILLLLLFFGGSGVVLYIIAWIIIPKTHTEQEKQMMRDMHNGIL